MSWFTGGLIVCAFACRSLAESSSVPTYQIGDKATEDIVTPVALVVLNAERTKALRQQEANRVPAIFRYYPKTIDEAENDLRASFTTNRAQFLDLIEASYKRRKLAATAVVQERFHKMIASFQKQHRSFPLSTNLAEMWVLDQSDELLQAELVTRLRQVMEHYIRPENLPPAAKAGPGQIRIISLSSRALVPDLEAVDSLGFGVARTNVFWLGKLRKEMVASAPAEEQATAKFIGSFLRENYVFDETLTRQSRARRTDPIWAADNYSPGEVIVKSGELISAKTKLALDQLREKLSIDQIKIQAAQEKVKAQTTVAQFQQQAALAHEEALAADRRNRWLGGGLLVLLSGGAVWQFARRKRPRSLLPALVGDTVVDFSPAGTESAVGVLSASDSWKARALAAEQRALQAQAVVRAGLLPKLARWLNQRLVRGLLVQRASWIDTQRQAELAIAEFENRLIKVRAPLEERLKAYEKRIVELENELAAKGEENRELLKATIATARKKLEAERSKSSFDWN